MRYVVFPAHLIRVFVGGSTSHSDGPAMCVVRRRQRPAFLRRKQKGGIAIYDWAVDLDALHAYIYYTVRAYDALHEADLLACTLLGCHDGRRKES